MSRFAIGFVSPRNIDVEQMNLVVARDPLPGIGVDRRREDTRAVLHVRDEPVDVWRPRAHRDLVLHLAEYLLCHARSSFRSVDVAPAMAGYRSMTAKVVPEQQFQEPYPTWLAGQHPSAPAHVRPASAGNGNRAPAAVSDDQAPGSGRTAGCAARRSNTHDRKTAGVLEFDGFLRPAKAARNLASYPGNSIRYLHLGAAPPYSQSVTDTDGPVKCPSSAQARLRAALASADIE